MTEQTEKISAVMLRTSRKMREQVPAIMVKGYISSLRGWGEGPRSYNLEIAHLNVLLNWVYDTVWPTVSVTAEQCYLLECWDPIYERKEKSFEIWAQACVFLCQQQHAFAGTKKASQLASVAQYFLYAQQRSDEPIPSVNWAIAAVIQAAEASDDPLTFWRNVDPIAMLNRMAETGEGEGNV